MIDELTVIVPCALWHYREKEGDEWLTRRGPGHWDRARVNPRTGGRSNTTLHEAWKALVARHLRAAIERAGVAAPVFRGPVQIDMIFITPRPKKDGDLFAGRWWDTRVPDGSNFQKGVEDAAIGLAYVDDRQIARWSGSQVICAPSEEPTCCVTFVDLSRTPVPPLLATDLQREPEAK